MSGYARAAHALGPTLAAAFANSPFDALGRATARGFGAGRPLFAANRALPVPDDPVVTPWEQAAAFGCLVASITVQQIGTTGTATPDKIAAARARW